MKGKSGTGRSAPFPRDAAAVWTEHKGGDIVTHCRDGQEQSVLCLRILVQVDLRLSGVA